MGSRVNWFTRVLRNKK